MGLDHEGGACGAASSDPQPVGKMAKEAPDRLIR